jgi:hypothetical protein
VLVFDSHVHAVGVSCVATLILAGGADKGLPLRERGLRDVRARVRGGGLAMGFDRPRSSGDKNPDPPDNQRPPERPAGQQQPEAGHARSPHETRSRAEYAREVMSKPPISRERAEDRPPAGPRSMADLPAV